MRNKIITIAKKIRDRLIRDKLNFIIFVLFFFCVSLFSYFLLKNTVLIYPNKFDHYLVNIPNIRPIEIKFIPENDSFLVLLNDRVKKNPELFWWDNILVKFKKIKDRNILRIYILQYEIECKEDEWVALEPVPQYPIITEIPEKGIFLPIRELDLNRYMIKYKEGSFIIWDKFENKYDSTKSVYSLFGNVVNLQYIKLGKRIRLTFNNPLRLLSVPFSGISVIIGNYEIYYKYPFLYPSVIVPYDFYYKVKKLCSKGIISYDSEKRKLKIRIPSESERELKRIFYDVFEVKDTVIIWRRFKKYLSTKKDRKSEFYGKFDEKFFTPWLIKNGRVYGIKTYYLSQNVSLSKLLRQDVLSIVKDRNGRSLFIKNTPVLNSLWNILSPTNLNDIIDEYISSKDFKSQIRYYFVNEKEKNIYLSIDLNTQKVLESVIEDFATKANKKAKSYFKKIFGSPYPHIGAVILSDSGEILAAVSYPYPKSLKEFIFYANNISETQNWRNSPLMNRVWKERYPIGSTVKPIIANMALNLGIYIKKMGKYYIPDVWGEDKIFIDKKGFIDRIGRYRIKPLRNYKYYKYPFKITFRDFLVRSINVASAKLLCSFPKTYLRRFSSYWNIGEFFLLEDRFKKISSFGFPKFTNPFWCEGATIIEYDENDLTRISRLSIGDGIYSSILYLTSLYLSLDKNEWILPTLQKGKGKVLLSPWFMKNYSRLITDYLEGVVKDSKGTAYHAFKNLNFENVKIWGKTGTAEVFKKKSHKLFVCGIELYNKKYYMGVIVENAEGLFGYNPAALIVKNFIAKLMVNGNKIKR